jgi:prepilin-type N-terminal cleavage/methylation domain-containing protein
MRHDDNSLFAVGSRDGFTLIELLVVIVIIGILVGALIPATRVVRDKAKETQVVNDIGEIHKAIEQFGVDHSGKYPYRIRHFLNRPGSANTPDADSLLGAQWAPLGLFGGAEALNPDLSIATLTYPEPQIDNSYRLYFNQRSDPLVALGYLKQYPQNPFLKRGMGCIVWAFDPTDMTKPSPDVRVAPGDFVYTFYMTPLNGAFQEPPGVATNALSYTATSSDGSDGRRIPGTFSLSMVDGYQLWAYGLLRSTGIDYMCYPNTSSTPPTQPVSIRADWNGNGKKDLFETGIIAYFQSETNAAGRNSTTGQKLEY